MYLQVCILLFYFFYDPVCQFDCDYACLFTCVSKRVGICVLCAGQDGRVDRIHDAVAAVIAESNGKGEVGVDYCLPFGVF